MGLNPLVDKIRAQYPGAYDDMDDATLTKSVLAKYPQYSDLAAPKVQQPVQPESGVADKILGELGNDDLSQQGSAAYAARQKAGTQEQGLGGGLNSFEGSIADQGKSNAMSATGATAAAGLGGAEVLPPVVEALTSAAEAHPVIAKLLLKGLEVGGGSAATAGIYKLLNAFKPHTSSGSH